MEMRKQPCDDDPRSPARLLASPMRVVEIPRTPASRTRAEDSDRVPDGRRGDRVWGRAGARRQEASVGFGATLLGISRAQYRTSRLQKLKSLPVRPVASRPCMLPSTTRALRPTRVDSTRCRASVPASRPGVFLDGDDGIRGHRCLSECGSARSGPGGPFLDGRARR